MESPEDIEKALAALLPAAISERGQRSLDELIDSLAAGEAPLAELPELEAEPEAEPAAAPAPVVSRRPWAWAGIAGAAGAFAAAVAMVFQMPATTGRPSFGTTPDLATVPVVATTTPEVESLGRNEFVDSAVPENWMSVKDGVPHRAVRIYYVEEEHLRDKKTGYEMVRTQTREDLDWLPIDTF